MPLLWNPVCPKCLHRVINFIFPGHTNGPVEVERQPFWKSISCPHCGLLFTAHQVGGWRWSGQEDPRPAIAAAPRPGGGPHAEAV